MIEMKYSNRNDKGEYVIGVQRVVKLGIVAYITPSDAYAGIEPGYVKVVDIVTSEEYLAAPHRFPDMTQELNIAVTGVDTDEILDRDTLSTDERAIYDDIMSRPWVVYRYLNNKNMGNTRFYLSIGQFILHASNIQ